MPQRDIMCEKRGFCKTILQLRTVPAGSCTQGMAGTYEKEAVESVNDVGGWMGGVVMCRALDPGPYGSPSVLSVYSGLVTVWTELGCELEEYCTVRCPADESWHGSRSDVAWPPGLSGDCEG